MGLLDTELRQTIGEALSTVLLDLTYTPPSSGGTYSAGAWSGATAGTARTCKGFVDEDIAQLVPDVTQRKATHRRVLITQTSLAVTPEQDGKVAARSETLTVLQVRQDPAMATWELLAEV